MVWEKAKQTKSHGCTPCEVFCTRMSYNSEAWDLSTLQGLCALFTPQHHLVLAILQIAFIIEFYGFISLHCVCFYVIGNVFSFNADSYVNFFRYISKCHFACSAQVELVFVTKI